MFIIVFNCLSMQAKEFIYAVLEQLMRPTVFQMFLLQHLRQDWVYNIMLMKLLVKTVGRLSREVNNIQTMKEDRMVKLPLQQPALVLQQELTKTRTWSMTINLFNSCCRFQPRINYRNNMQQSKPHKNFTSI